MPSPDTTTAYLLAALVLAAAGPAAAQPQQGQVTGQAQQGTPAEELVGLFGATCLHYPGNATALRGFLQQQKVPAMPEKARDAFLAGRPGQVFDASEPGVNLALVSLDDGACEAVVEKANPGEIEQALQKAAREAGTPVTPLGNQGDKPQSGVHHAAYSITQNGQTMHILVATSNAPPQGVLILAPR